MSWSRTVTYMLTKCSYPSKICCLCKYKLIQHIFNITVRFAARSQLILSLSNDWFVWQSARADFVHGLHSYCCVCVSVCVSCRKKAVEMELAKCKIDIMSLNSQLLDAIQQKLNLSQQLEAWQVGQRLYSAFIFFFGTAHFKNISYVNANAIKDEVRLN